MRTPACSVFKVMGMKNNDIRGHCDSSEVFKRRSLTAAKRRKRMRDVAFAAVCLLAAAVLAACAWAYFFDKA